ncbi:MAG: POTRA domain-containing protein [Myxococcaceae bacterium]
MRALCAWALLGSSALAAAPPPAEAPAVLSVELQLPPNSKAELLADAPGLVALRKGQRLSARAVRRSIERLFATGRFADVVVRTLKTSGGVEVIFEVTPKQRVARVMVEGNRVLKDEEVLAAARLEKEAEYYPERVDEAVRAVSEAYRRRGYEKAQTTAELDDLGEGLELLFRVEEGEPTRVAGLSVAGSPGLPVARLEVALGVTVGDVLDADRLDEGLERLRAELRAEAFYRARVFDPVVVPGEQGAMVAVPVSAGPRYQLHLHGNRSFSDEVLLAVAAYDGTETLDRAVMGRLARRLAGYYRYKGFADARVEPRETVSPNGQRAILAFDIEEGRPLKVSEVVFSGNRELTDARLRQLLTEVVVSSEPVPVGDVHPNEDPLKLEGRTRQGPHADPPAPDPSTVYVETAYRDAAEAMTGLYHERGYLSAKAALTGVEVDVDGRTARVAFQIDEGPRAVVREVTFRGGPQAFDFREGQTLEVGGPFSYAALEQARLSLTRALGRRGYLFARVEPQAEVSASGTDVRVVLQMQPGPQVRVGKVLLHGLQRTVERVVRSTLKVKEGEVLDPEDLFDTQRDLVLMGIFRTVAVRLLAPETPEPVKDVVVEVVERPRMSGEIGGGYFLAEGPRLVVDAVYPNVGGLAINAAARGKVYYVGASAQVLSADRPTDLAGLDLFGGRGNLSAQNRGLLPLNIGWRVDLIAERVHRPFYRFTRFAGVPGLDWSTLLTVKGIDWAKLKIALNLQYEIENDRVFLVEGVGQLLPTLARQDEENLRFPKGEFSLQSLRFGPTFDLRDDAANPHKGVLLAFTGERTWDLYTPPIDEEHDGRPIQTLKVSGTLTGYIPVTSTWVLALSARGGKIFLLDPASVTIAPKRFFLGGASSMRGFREDGLIPSDRRPDLAREVDACRALANPVGCTEASKTLLSGKEVPSEGGEVFALAKAELRFPAFGAVDLGLFLEAGNLWLSQPRPPFTLRYVAGAGFRYVTPIGPLALDFGVNLFPDETLNEPAYNLHFNIGLF